MTLAIARPAPSANMRGVLWMLASALGFTVMATCIKLLAIRDYSESQMLFLLPLPSASPPE